MPGPKMPRRFCLDVRAGTLAAIASSPAPTRTTSGLRPAKLAATASAARAASIHDFTAVRPSPQSACTTMTMMIGLTP
jgi:hypothetical protein